MLLGWNSGSLGTVFACTLHTDFPEANTWDRAIEHESELRAGELSRAGELLEYVP